MHDNSSGQRPPLSNPSREHSRRSEPDGLEPNPTRNLQLLRAGSLQLAIFQDEIATIVQWREPAPLPHAPRSVLGVVSIQGRMLTVLDISALTSDSSLTSDSTFRHILALRGDEQLAVAADGLGEIIGISDEGVEREKGVFLRVFKHGNGEVSIVNTKELFATALHGRERRRRRF